MTQNEFDKLSKALDFMAKQTMKSKGPEYTQEKRDVLTNFKCTAERLNTTELKVWGAYFDKQISSVFAHLNNANLKKAESIESRFADIINYCHLGLALFKERQK
tara:strand:- start:307 stop:618 length:312 start_codon:yes stop_codon:yes gene_type:complete